MSEVSDIAGSSAGDPLALTPDDVERLATLANIEPQVLEPVALSLAEQDVWQQSMDGVRAIYDDASQSGCVTNRCHPFVQQTRSPDMPSRCLLGTSITWDMDGRLEHAR